MELVGRITGMADCRWNDPTAAPASDTESIPRGRKYVLDSGLMEISYDSGAKVILQGPCTYEVESETGGFLSLGKLTAKVERGEGRGERGEGTANPKSQIPNQQISNPQSLIPNPLFSVRTPTAIVTDLGTEFGVEVDKAGVTESHVFRGKVELRPADGGKGGTQTIQLSENESARVEPNRNHGVKVIRGSSADTQPQGFARRMPRRIPIRLFNTGIELREGDPDPHWQLVARSDQPHFKPRPAVVTAVDFGFWLANYAARSQWISTDNGPPELPNGVTYTFRMTFELADVPPEGAVLRGRFIADDYVAAIRLNGKQLPVPEHRKAVPPFDCFSDEFSVASGFVEGANALEIDVVNSGEPSAPRESGHMGLRVELGGSLLLTQSDDRGQPRRKEMSQ